MLKTHKLRFFKILKKASNVSDQRTSGVDDHTRHHERKRHRGNMQQRECADCGEVIEEKRMKFLPDTTTCVTCQRIREKNGHFVRHKMDIQATCKAGEIDEIHETIIRAHG